MPFDSEPAMTPMVINIMCGVLSLKENGATPKAIRSWLIGRTTYHERNRIMEAIVYT